MINKERILTLVSWENMSWFTATRETQTENDLLVQTGCCAQLQGRSAAVVC